MTNLLEIRGLKITTLRGKNTVRLLDRVDLDIPKKCAFGIVGESGCGKSITANAVLGLLPWICCIWTKSSSGPSADGRSP